MLTLTLMRLDSIHEQVMESNILCWILQFREIVQELSSKSSLSEEWLP